MSDRLVILGAGGDLARRFLYPALAELQAGNRLPDDLEVIAVSRDQLSDDTFRAQALEAMEAQASDVPLEARRLASERLVHRTADATDTAAMGELFGVERPSIAYLALPHGLFESVIESLTACGMPDGSRIVVEKPFGNDLESARRLNELLRAGFTDDAVFRMDHFFGMATTRSLLALRAANRIFEPAWNASEIERVEITWDETLALEGRSSYYDHAGALRDMIQNHLLALLSVVAMELDEPDPRDARVAVLRAVRSLDEASAAERSVRARYGAGSIGDRRVPAYVDEEGVDADRDTETFAQLTLHVDTPRWDGVPFVLRSGKALGRDRHEIVLCFRPPEPRSGFDGSAEANRLRLDLDENRLELRINTAGAVRGAEPREVELGERLPGAERSAYATMLMAVLDGDQTIFAREDETEEAWRIVQPVLDAWADERPPMLEYAAGSDGPS